MVLVNPTTSEYRIDWERSALVNGLVPAQFTVAEDNKTYDLSGQAGPLMEILQILKANNVAAQSDGRHPVQPGAARPDPGGGAPRGRTTGAGRATDAGRRGARGGAVVTPPEPPIATRLQELKDLHASGALTDDEYTSRRAAIISEI